MENQTNTNAQASTAQNLPSNIIASHSTSFIPSKAELYLPKKIDVSMKLIHIEVIHVIIFFLLLYCLYVFNWKRPNLR